METSATSPEPVRPATLVTATEQHQIRLAYLTSQKPSLRALGQKFGRAEATIKKIIDAPETIELADRLADGERKRAVRVLERAQVEAATLWASTALPIAAKRGNHKAARDLLIATKAIEEKPVATVTVAVGVKAEFCED